VKFTTCSSTGSADELNMDDNIATSVPARECRDASNVVSKSANFDGHPMANSAAR
jgi:hypothetical protein